jgi:hypothetical protein
MDVTDWSTMLETNISRVDIVTRLGAGQPRNPCTIASKVKGLIFFPNSQAEPATPTVFYSVGAGSFVAKGKASRTGLATRSVHLETVMLQSDSHVRLVGLNKDNFICEG